MIGEIAGIQPGTIFANRRELYDAGVHRTLQAGIVGTERTGAESVVLSGGYVDDEDQGYEVIYTGRGGRDQKTGRQVADQEFEGQNAALVVSRREGLPVRVVRGAGHDGPNTPERGFRYDGLYWVEDHWRERGRDGFFVCRYRLVDRASRNEEYPVNKQEPAPRRLSTILRIVRDTGMSKQVKALHKHRCQICGEALETGTGPYAEGAHIRPLGNPHNGPDEAANLLCLCPNHHVLFDYGRFQINDDFSLLGLAGKLRTAPGHNPAAAHLAYRRRMWGFDEQTVSSRAASR